MKFNSTIFILTFLLVVPFTFAAVNGKCSDRNGICIQSTKCDDYGGVSYSGKCPSDPNDIKCCDSIPCTADDGREGNCMFEDECSEDQISGKCPGGNDFKCCVKSIISTNGENYDSISTSFEETKIPCTADDGREGNCMYVDQCSGDLISGKCPGGNDFKCCVKSTNTNPTTAGNPGSISTKFDGTKLNKEQFVSKVSSYCSLHPNEIASEMCNNLNIVYSTSKSSNVNPELVIARAMVEGNDPGISKHNYWGMGCTNTGGIEACFTYSSLQAGIKDFGKNVSKYKNLAEMMSKYAYIGKYWYNPGSWGIGGCKYFPYIKKYMSTERQSIVTNICSKSTKCNKKGGDCTKTTPEDQNAYATWQVKDKLGPYMCKVFGTCY